MKSIPALNAESHRQLVVGPADGITLGKQTAAPITVFSTPSMIMMMELTASDLLAPFLDADEGSVGVTVDIKHLAPTPLGATVQATARLVAVEKKLFDFEVVATDAGGEIGRGMHRRAVVTLPKFQDMLTKRTGGSAPVGRAALPPPPSGVSIQWALVNGVGTLTFNRENKLNAIDATMTGELERAIDYLEHPECPVRVVILSGAGRAFCAGEDIKENAAFDPSQSLAFATRRGRICQRFSRLAQPVIARVHGPCMGGGMALALAADWILASHSATFSMPEIKLGWPPAYALDALLSRVGRPAALRIALLGVPMSAADALDIGLVDAVLATNQLDSEVQRLAQTLVALPGNGLKETKATLWALGPGNATSDLEHNLAAYNRCRSHPNATLGMQAFLGKTKPKFG
ncbi:MAG: enoyl-CoA hydratase-related protein [Verrucomicrobiota bacterium]|nr:enoyl-CoA hydratase-related protein [Verrucomicrobiota bacterium]